MIDVLSKVRLSKVGLGRGFGGTPKSDHQNTLKIRKKSLEDFLSYNIKISPSCLLNISQVGNFFPFHIKRQFLLFIIIFFPSFTLFFLKISFEVWTINMPSLVKQHYFRANWKLQCKSSGPAVRAWYYSKFLYDIHRFVCKVDA